MFGIEPETLTNLSNLQKQILEFMEKTTKTLQYIELQIEDIQDEIYSLHKESENG